MKKHGSLTSIVLFASRVLSACGTPFIPASTATSPSIPGIEVMAGETVVRIIEVTFGKYIGARVRASQDDLGTLGGYEAKPGFHYAELILDTYR